MAKNDSVENTSNRELMITRTYNASPEKVYKACTEPELLKQWFAPAPWTTSVAETDLRPGGSSLIVMKSPEGEEYPNRGVYLEIIPYQKLVFTDAYVNAWTPSEKPFMTVEVTFEAVGKRTKYTARVIHFTEADKLQHEAMGFHKGWGQCADQLGKLVDRKDSSAQ